MDGPLDWRTGSRYTLTHTMNTTHIHTSDGVLQQRSASSWQRHGSVGGSLSRLLGVFLVLSGMLVIGLFCSYMGFFCRCMRPVLVLLVGLFVRASTAHHDVDGNVLICLPRGQHPLIARMHRCACARVRMRVRVHASVCARMHARMQAHVMCLCASTYVTDTYNTVHTTHEASAYTDARMQVCKHAGRHACSARHRHAGSSVCARCAHTLTLTHSLTHTYTHTHTSTHLPRCWRCACQTALRARHSSPRPKQAPPVGRPCRAPRPAPDEDLLPRAGKGLRVSQTLRHQIQHGDPGLGGGGARRAATAAPWSARATRSALVTYAARQGVRCPRCWVCRVRCHSCRFPEATRASGNLLACVSCRFPCRFPEAQHTQTHACKYAFHSCRFPEAQHTQTHACKYAFQKQVKYGKK